VAWISPAVAGAEFVEDRVDPGRENISGPLENIGSSFGTRPLYVALPMGILLPIVPNVITLETARLRAAKLYELRPCERILESLRRGKGGERLVS
jgi:hypothetical protein